MYSTRSNAGPEAVPPDQFGGHAGSLGDVECPAWPVDHDDSYAQAGLDGRLQQRPRPRRQHAKADFITSGCARHT